MINNGGMIEADKIISETYKTILCDVTNYIKLKINST